MLALPLLNAKRQRLSRGLDVTSTKRFTMMLGAAVLTIASSLPSEAQIIYPFPPYGMAVIDASVQFDVTPRQAEVFIDGYYAGIVDDFDGMFQRLRVEPGQHEITALPRRISNFAAARLSGPRPHVQSQAADGAARTG